MDFVIEIMAHVVHVKLDFMAENVWITVLKTV